MEVLKIKLKTFFLSLFSKGFRNTLYLYFYQTVEYIFLFFLIIYINRRIGVSYFGKFMFVYAIIQYFLILVDFGFDLSATKSVSIYRNSKKKLSYIFSTVLLSRTILLILSALIYFSFVYLFVKESDRSFFILMFGLVVARAYMPFFFFLGIENLYQIVLSNIISKTIVAFCMFLMVKDSNSFSFLPGILSMVFLLQSVYLIIYVFRKFGLEFIGFTKFKIILNTLKKNFNIFLGNGASSMYITSNTFLLGLLSSNYLYVAYYSLAEKIVRICRYIISPYIQAIFPKFAQKIYRQGKKKIILELLSLIRNIWPFLVGIQVLLLFVSPLAIILFTGNFVKRVFFDIIILSSILSVGTVNNILVVLGLINLGLYSLFRNIIFMAGLVNLVLTIFLAKYFSDIGASISLMLTEIFLLILLLKVILNKDAWV